MSARAGLAIAALLLLAHTALAQTDPLSTAAFPDCAWRQWPSRVGAPTTHQGFYCKQSDGKLKRLLYVKAFTPDTFVRAKAGDPAAIGIIGWVYMVPLETQDPPRGLALLRQASQMGDAAATNLLAFYADAGIFVSKDKAEALRLYRLSASRGNGEAMRHIAQAYEFGDGVKADGILALRWYRKAAQAGDTEAMAAFGTDCPPMICPQVSPAERLRWLTKAADTGSLAAMNRLSGLYQSGEKGIAPDPVKAKFWSDRADAPGLQDLYDNINGFDPTTGDGGAPFEYMLGNVYMRGVHSIPPNIQMAIKWYADAAADNDRDAAEALEAIYTDGRDVPADKALAAKYHRRLREIATSEMTARAERGDPEAMKDLAALYLNGADPYDNLIGDKNPALGAGWLREAAFIGDDEAAFAMDAIYALDPNPPAMQKDRPSLEARIETRDGLAMIDMSRQLFRKEWHDAAVFWYYEALLRGRAYVAEHPDKGQLFQILAGDFATEIEPYAMQDRRKLAETIDRVIVWDESHPDSAASEQAHKNARAALKAEIQSAPVGNSAPKTP